PSSPTPPPASARIDELVPGAVDGQDVARLAAAVADLGPQLRDVRVDRARGRVALVAPDVLEQLLARDGVTLALDEVAQQLELARREVERLAALLRPVGLEVQLDVREPVAGQALLAALRASQYRAHTREQLADRERLGDVVVRAQFEAHDLVDLL